MNTAPPGSAGQQRAGWRTPLWGAIATGAAGVIYLAVAVGILASVPEAGSGVAPGDGATTDAAQLNLLGGVLAVAAVGLFGQLVAVLWARAAARRTNRPAAGARCVASGSMWLQGILAGAVIGTLGYRMVTQQQLGVLFFAALVTLIPLLFGWLTYRTVVNLGHGGDTGRAAS